MPGVTAQPVQLHSNPASAWGHILGLQCCLLVKLIPSSPVAGQELSGDEHKRMDHTTARVDWRRSSRFVPARLHGRSKGREASGISIKELQIIEIIKLPKAILSQLGFNEL